MLKLHIYIALAVGLKYSFFVVFEPTLIGGSARTGKTKIYNLHYVALMLGFLGKLPFFTAADKQQDIVPV